MSWSSARDRRVGLAQLCLPSGLEVRWAGAWLGALGLFSPLPWARLATDSWSVLDGSVGDLTPLWCLPAGSQALKEMFSEARAMTAASRMLVAVDMLIDTGSEPRAGEVSLASAGAALPVEEPARNSRARRCGGRELAAETTEEARPWLLAAINWLTISWPSRPREESSVMGASRAALAHTYTSRRHQAISTRTHLGHVIGKEVVAFHVVGSPDFFAALLDGNVARLEGSWGDFGLLSLAPSTATLARLPTGESKS